MERLFRKEGRQLSELRSTTLKEIERSLDKSYFALGSFKITNHPEKSPFLIIKFIPEDRFQFSVSKSGYGVKGSFSTEQAPGEHLASGEKFTYDSFEQVISAIDKWTNRIDQDFLSRRPPDVNVEQFVQNLRNSIDAAPNEPGYFSSEEVATIRDRLSELERIVVEQAEKLDDSEKQLKSFQMQLNEVKNDLEKFPKGVWYKVAGNKLIRAVSDFASSESGRKLISEGIKRLLDWK
ncbi:hypothetical protein [Rheinheimera sp.]|uniref:hypothetical protein n=1 Tax=Rheinheimera sp. TaxID=1869214 RepID=UPI0023541B7D|nr:hypothetical protein [Rheinheimera sp.]